MSAGPAHVVVMGVSGTGKSTVGARLAERLGVAFVEGDDLHPPANVAKMSEGVPLTDEDRWPWLEAVAARLAAEERGGRTALVTCSALRRSYRDLLREGAGSDSVFFLHLHTDERVLLERMARRTHFMPTTLLRSQLETLEPLQHDELGALVDVDAPVDQIVAESAGALGEHGLG